MNSNLNLTKQEEKFAIKHIDDFYSSNANCKYFELINSILGKFEYCITDFDELASDDYLENCIIKKLLSVFIEQLNYQKEHNEMGLFGVKKGFFSDGNIWYYKNSIKNEFIYSHPIYAHSLKELKIKVSKDNGLWFIFDLNLLRNFLLMNIGKNTKNDVLHRKYPRIPNKVLFEFVGEDINDEKYFNLIKKDKEHEKEIREKADKIKEKYKGEYITSIFDEDYNSWDIYKFFK